ncbi:MAG: DUF1501 domain-containing protein [Gemmatales bacterium]
MFTRRHLLHNSFTSLALGHLLAGDCAADEVKPRPEWNGGLHHKAKVRRVIQLFMNGGVSQVDTFDYKPRLIEKHGQQIDFGIKASATGVPGPVMKSPFAWKQHGQSGRWVTDVLPHMARCVDDMAFLMAQASRTNVHGPASYLQNTGFLLPGFPCAGAWISYALGRLSDNLPAFVVLPDVRGLPYNGMGNFSAGFLPASHQGVVIQPGEGTSIPDLHAHASAKYVTPTSSAAGLELLKKMNQEYAQAHPGDSRLTSRIEGYELAARMQMAAPEAFDLSKEPQKLHDLYGTGRGGHDGAFARNCLLARRLVERGTRFVQVWSGAGGPSHNWDNHANIIKELPPIARQVDQPTAALFMDLKSRGLLEDTLLIWTTEFGRMPFTQSSTGRDHNGGTFVTWLAGAGIKPGISLGESDEFGYRAVKQKTTCYDLHATVLHLMGIDHEKLTVRQNGVNRRLTDVHGEVIREVLV